MVRIESLLACPKPGTTEPPLSPGQIICCQIDPRTSVEGYSARAGNPEFQRDANLTRQRWTTAIRPALVLEVERDKYSGLWTVQVACIGQGDPNLLGDEVIFAPISPSRADGNVVPSPAWPVPNTYCYVFMYPTIFYCYPGEVLHYLVFSGATQLKCNASGQYYL